MANGSYLGVAVIHGKVGDDDRYGQGNGQYAGQGAESPDEHADVGFGSHVSVADGGHGDQGPPQSERDAVEVVVRIGLDPLGVVDEAGEDDDAQDEEEDEERQLLGRGPERLDENLEPGRVARQFEQPHDADDGEELEDVGVLQMGGELLQGQVDEERQGGHVVDDVDRGPDEEELVGAGDEAHQDLDREPRVADGLDVEEGLVGVGLRLVQRPGRGVERRVHRQVADHRHPHVRMRFQAERQDRNADEEHRYQTHNLFKSPAKQKNVH